jgi:hypothetical protein
MQKNKGEKVFRPVFRFIDLIFYVYPQLHQLAAKSDLKYVNPSITGTSVIGLRPASPWRVFKPYKQRKRGYWHHSG